MHESCHHEESIWEIRDGMEDWNALTACLAGTDQGVESRCECLDLDGDGHVDMVDVAEFMHQFDGQ